MSASFVAMTRRWRLAATPCSTRALAALEEQRGAYASFALAAVDGHLLARIRRLLLSSAGAPPRTGAAVAIRLSLLPIGALLLSHAADARPTGTMRQTEAGGTTRLASETSGTNVSCRSPLFTRTYKVDPLTFLDGARAALNSEQPAVPLNSSDTTNATVQQLVRDYLRNEAGVAFPPVLLGATPAADPPEKALIYNHGNGMLLVRASLQELDRIERAVTKANQPIPQVLVEVKFAEADDRLIRDLPLGSLLTNSASPVMITNAILRSAVNGVPAQPGALPNSPPTRATKTTRLDATAQPGKVRLLTPEQLKAVLHAMEQSSGAAFLAAPRVTTRSGQQAQVAIIELKNIATSLEPSGAMDAITTTQVPLGPCMDVIPTVREDGRTIDLTVLPSLTEFIGYAIPNPYRPKDLQPLPLPRFRTRQTVVRAAVPDGQTVAIVGFGPSDPE
jgi:type II secretory pathway component GspD/PulD (secretin)